MPPNGSIDPTGVIGTVFIKSFFVTLRTPVLPDVTFTNNSSVPATFAIASLLEINVFLIDILKVFSSPVLPSKSKLGASTSPDTLNVVALASLFALSAVPFTVPVISPSSDPLNFKACTVSNICVSEPMLSDSDVDGKTLLATVVTPVIETSLPTFKFSAMPTPPAVTIEPELISVLDDVFSITITPLVGSSGIGVTLTLPTTCNASSGEVLFTPNVPLLATVNTSLNLSPSLSENLMLDAFLLAINCMLSVSPANTLMFK